MSPATSATQEKLRATSHRFVGLAGRCEAGGVEAAAECAVCWSLEGTSVAGAEGTPVAGTEGASVAGTKAASVARAVGTSVAVTFFLGTSLVRASSRRSLSDCSTVSFETDAGSEGDEGNSSASGSTQRANCFDPCGYGSGHYSEDAGRSLASWPNVPPAEDPKAV